MSNEMTRDSLKIQALLETISRLESEKAELRVDVTILGKINESTQERVAELEAFLTEIKPTESDDNDE